MSCDEWTAVLRLATLWRFEQVRSLAATKLHKLADPVMKIILYGDARNELPAEHWLIPAVRSIAERKEAPGLSVEEANRLGTERVLQVFTVRERYCVARRSFMLSDVDSIVCEVFGITQPQNQ